MLVTPSQDVSGVLCCRTSAECRGLDLAFASQVKSAGLSAISHGKKMSGNPGVGIQDWEFACVCVCLLSVIVLPVGVIGSRI